MVQGRTGKAAIRGSLAKTGVCDGTRHDARHIQPRGEDGAEARILEQRLARIERELATQDRVLTELRRDLALHRPQYDPTKPLPGMVPVKRSLDQ